MDVSLDELIKNKRSSSRGIASRGFRGGKRGASNVCSNGAGGSGDGGGPMRRRRFRARNSNGFTPYSKGNVNAWTRNTYEGPKRHQIRGGLSTANIHKIVISNLHFGVTSTDIQLLFNEFGPLKTAAVHHNTFGKSLGTANVVFHSKIAALNAVRQYNNVPLDGRPMKIELVTDLSIVANLATRLSRPAPLRVRGIRGGVRGKGGKRGAKRVNFSGRGGGSSGSRGRKNSKKNIPNKDELDAQLDSFIKSKNN